MIFAGVCDGRLYPLPNALSVEIDRELYVPADDLTAVFPYGEVFYDLRMQKIFALNDDCFDIDKAVAEKNVLFSGIVDEQILNISADGASVKIVARSIAAVLLDNECAPIKYVNPSLNVICRRHIEPFGIEFEETDLKCRPGELIVPKGSSHYKVIERFCSDFLGTVPFVDCGGVCRFDVFAGAGNVVFDNDDGIAFSSISVCENRYKRVSRIFVSGDNGYDTTVNDYESQSLGIVRERYLNLYSSETGSLSDADNIIQNGKMQSFSVTLMCEGCLTDILGFGAEVNAEGCEGKSFVVSQIRYTADSTAEKTRVKLFLAR